MMAFGLPGDIWPVHLENGELNLQPHLHFLASLQKKNSPERTSTASIANDDAVYFCNKVAGDSEKPLHHVSSSCPFSMSIRDDDFMVSPTHNLQEFQSNIINEIKHTGNKPALLSLIASNKTPEECFRATRTKSRKRFSPTADLGPFDIVVGRGRHAVDSVAHSRFKQLIVNYAKEYDATPRRKRYTVVNKVLYDFRGLGCAFSGAVSTVTGS